MIVITDRPQSRVLFHQLLAEVLYETKQRNCKSRAEESGRVIRNRDLSQCDCWVDDKGQRCGGWKNVLLDLSSSYEIQLRSPSMNFIGRTYLRLLLLPWNKFAVQILITTHGEISKFLPILVPRKRFEIFFFFLNKNYHFNVCTTFLLTILSDVVQIW